MAKQKFNQEEAKLIKFLKYILGHRPDEFGLWPGDDGYFLIKDLLQTFKFEDGFKNIRENKILQLANTITNESDFEILDKKIRLKPELSYLHEIKASTLPIPKILYLPIKPNSWENISTNGLIAKYSENFALLWADKEIANKIGKRISHEHLLIEVLTTVALKNKNSIISINENLYKTNFISADSLKGPTIKEKTEKELLLIEKRKQNKRSKQLEKMGTFDLPVSSELIIHKGKKKGKHEDSPDWKNQSRRQRRKNNDGDW